jgi:hypothetical protein
MAGAYMKLDAVQFGFPEIRFQNGGFKTAVSRRLLFFLLLKHYKRDGLGGQDSKLRISFLGTTS